MIELIALLALQVPPAGAIWLFEGADALEWVQRGGGEPCKWEVRDGALIVRAGTPDIVSKREFADYRLHLEFWLPRIPDAKDQARANSGVYNQGRWEIQILDMWDNTTYPTGGCGAIYGQKDPDGDAIKPPENWNSFDIVFTAARFDADGKVVAKPRISAWHNGVRIHRDVELNKSSTTAGLDGPLPRRGPILIQNHGAPIKFRNIWVVDLGYRRLHRTRS